MGLTEELKKRLVNSIDLSRNISDEELNDIISKLVFEEYREKHLSLKEKEKVCRELFHSIRGLDILEEALAEDEITEIMVNGPNHIFIEKQGILQKYEGTFSSEEKLMDIIQQIVAGANKRVNEASPIVDTRLKDGSRVNIVLSPIAINGPVMTIRKFPKEAITMEKLIAMKSITSQAADFLERRVKGGSNIFISGGTGSGKTTFLNILAGFIPKEERVVTIEDSAELQIKGIENLVSLECRPANTEGENEITVRDLIKASLRMRPNRIVVGEVRGAEALDMLQAMNTGHDGSLSTGHGNSPTDMLTRLETMVMMGADIPLEAIRNQIASAIDLMVHLARMKDGSRKVVEITEVAGYENGAYVMNPLFVYGKREITDGKEHPGILNGQGKKYSARLYPTGRKMTRKKGAELWTSLQKSKTEIK
ncbi:MAG: CpaF family protein [Lachnospiraceae bacterium]|nr:CpaF family protein [Lachnospiraceae bacterium]